MNRSFILHYAARTVILAGFASYISQLVRSGELMQYIEPRMEAFIKCSAVVLYALAVYQAFLGYWAFRSGRQAECECGELPPFRLKAVLIYTVYALPLILGFWRM